MNRKTGSAILLDYALNVATAKPWVSGGICLVDSYGKSPAIIHFVGVICSVVLIFGGFFLPTPASRLINPAALLVTASAPVFWTIFPGRQRRYVSLFLKNDSSREATGSGACCSWVSRVRPRLISLLWCAGPLYFFIANVKETRYAITTVIVLVVIVSFATILFALTEINQFACLCIEERGDAAGELDESKGALGRLFKFEEDISVLYARGLNPWRLVLLTLMVIFLQYRHLDAYLGLVFPCLFVVISALSLITYATLRFSIMSLRFVFLIYSDDRDHSTGSLKEVDKILIDQYTLIMKLWKFMPSLYIMAYYLIYR